MELYRINTNNSLINSSLIDITQWILSGKLMKEMIETNVRVGRETVEGDRHLHQKIENQTTLIVCLLTANTCNGANSRIIIIIIIVVVVVVIIIVIVKVLVSIVVAN